jgi:hypothetical protein
MKRIIKTEAQSRIGTLREALKIKEKKFPSAWVKVVKIEEIGPRKFRGRFVATTSKVRGFG